MHIKNTCGRYWIMYNTLHFVASSNIKSLLGKDLVTDQIAALFELVKNSYDADAQVVEIIFEDITTGKGRLTIRDSGTGMDLNDLQTKWMVIGTDSKKKKNYSPIFHRPLNGDKGIGRFSVDRLGHKLYLASVKATKDSLKARIEMSFDWDQFEQNYSNIEDVQIPYKIERAVNYSQGLELVISDLRDNWNAAQIKTLVKTLRQFKSPFSQEDNFDIFITAKEFGYDHQKITIEALENISSLWVEVECRADSTDIVRITVNKDGVEYYEVKDNIHNIGPIKAKVYSFNQGDKIRFKNRFSVRVREFGNIRLYRDDFRIHPYGEADNDWLDMDRRYAQGFLRHFSSRDLIGYVQTYKKDNPDLQPLTNRQGLIENKAFYQLRQFIIVYCVSILEYYFFKKIKSGRDETLKHSKENMDQAVSILSQVASDIKQTNPEQAKLITKQLTRIKQGQSQQIEYAKGQEELTKVYSRIAQRETFLHKLIHQALIDVHDAKKASNGIRPYVEEKFDTPQQKMFLRMNECLSSAANTLRSTRDDVVRKRQKLEFNISVEIERFCRKQQSLLVQDEIVLKYNLQPSIMYKMDKHDLISIVNNLVTNSIKSLKQIHNRDRTIQVDLLKGARYIIIRVIDNGVGVDIKNREKIFDPFFTTTGAFGGIGIGLTIIDEIAHEYGGTLELVEQNTPGACFQVKLRCD